MKTPSATPTREPALPTIGLTVGFIPGVELDTFARRWRTDPKRPPLTFQPLAHSEQERALVSGQVDMVCARLPFHFPADGTTASNAPEFHEVRLWEEKTVAVMSSEHELTVLEELSSSDLTGVHIFPAEHSGDEKQRVELAATGAGVSVMPMSLARLHQRKDVTYRILQDRAPTQVALVWPAAQDNALRQEFVAVVRGRTARSSR